MSNLLFLACLFITLISSNEDACAAATPCVITRCPGCSVFNIAFYQTNPQTRETFFAFQVNNQCDKAAATPGVIYVEFNINSPSQGLTLVPNLAAGVTYQGSNYQWTVSQGAPQGTDALAAPVPTKYLRFTATGAGVVNGHQTGMVLGSGKPAFDVFRFSATGYDPTYKWVFRMTYADQFEVHGYIDISNCFCESCDSVHQKRIVQQCNLGYPDASTSRSSTVFNENLILYSFAVSGNFISLYYADEYPLMLGLGTVIDLDGVPVTAPKLFPVPAAPTCIQNLVAENFGFTNFDPKNLFGAVDNSGTANGCAPTKDTMTCPRPLVPALFLTDITANPSNRAGDWQQGGSFFFPQKVCGLFFYSQKIVASPRVNADGSINAAIKGFQSIPGLVLPATNSKSGTTPPLPPWDFGAGSDPIPVYAPTNINTNRFDYGVQVAWDVTKLPLKDDSNNRFQIMAHDGDSTKIGGDVGQACVNILVQCDPGFHTIPGSANKCTECDLTPLPGDGKWTWFCSPKSVPLPPKESPNQPYVLSKIPRSKLTQEPYATYVSSKTGFIPAVDTVDADGFRITCDCKRILNPCPLNCCGNGKCNFLNGLCTCAQEAQFLLNASTCCPTLAPTPAPKQCPNDCCSRVVCDTVAGVCNCPAPFNAAPFNPVDCCPVQAPVAPNTPTVPPTLPPCFNNGNGCNGNGVCNVAQNKCDCGPGFAGVDCSSPTPTAAPPPPCFNGGRFCSGNGDCDTSVNPRGVCKCNVAGAGGADCAIVPTRAPCSGVPGGDTCKTCLTNAQAVNITCVFCPNDQQNPKLNAGSCSESCVGIALQSCQEEVKTVPPVCFGNCSGNGRCVNFSTCAQIEVEQRALHGNDTTQWTENCGNNSARAAADGQNSTCACIKGFSGLNCLIDNGNSAIALAAGLGAGLTALVVIMALLGCAMASGGAVAVTQGAANAGHASVTNSPLYQEHGGSGANPLFDGQAAAYELM